MDSFFFSQSQCFGTMWKKFWINTNCNAFTLWRQLLQILAEAGLGCAVHWMNIPWKDMFICCLQTRIDLGTVFDVIVMLEMCMYWQKKYGDLRNKKQKQQKTAKQTKPPNTAVIIYHINCCARDAHVYCVHFWNFDSHWDTVSCACINT